MSKHYTENLGDFGFLELDVAGRLLKAASQHGFPDDFNTDGVKLGFNMNSGYVFFTNEEGQAAVLGGLDAHGHERLVSYYNLPSGLEGTLEDLKQEIDNMDPEDKESFEAIVSSYT
jgi:hypothetical protein